MSKITTQDCKLFLLDLYKDKNEDNWKRIRKFKDENGEVCREFSHSDGESVFLIEKNGQLSVLLSQQLTDLLSSQNAIKTVVTNKILTTTKVFNGKSAAFTLFDENQQKSAKRLVNAFVKPKEDPIEPDCGAKGFNAIPNLIQFSFLEDANCDETEYLEDIAKNMNFDAPMREIAVFFMPSTVKSWCEHISPLVEPFLTLPFYEAEEMSFKINESDTSLTVTDVFEHLSKSGFVYNPDGCALKELFSQYQLVDTAPVVKTNDKTAEYKKRFLSALKKDDVEKVKSLIDAGLPLSFKVGGQSLLGKTMHENKLECFKYLLTLYSNTANTGNGVADQIWDNVWWPNDCSRYFMENAVYDFTHSNKKAHSNLAITLMNHSSHFQKVKQHVNPEFFSIACLECTLTNDRSYECFKDFVKLAIEEYPVTVSNSKELSDDLVYGFIIPPILELLAGSSCTFGRKNVFDVVQSKIDEIGHAPKGYANKINYYRAFLKKYGR